MLGNTANSPSRNIIKMQSYSHIPLRFLLALCVALATSEDLFAQDSKPLQVYILAGQSNMQGSAHEDTFAAMEDDADAAPLLKQVIDSEGNPKTADHVWITYLTGQGDQDSERHGKLKVGYGFDEHRIGPEYGFGLRLEQEVDQPILIIKTAWGGKSLAIDFRPPSAGPYKPSDNEIENDRVPTDDQVGRYYREMMRHVRETLNDDESIRKFVPSYDASQGYEIAGFVWFQGWNDMCNRHHLEQYTDNMIHLIRDVRHDLERPQLPVAVGILGVYGTNPDQRRFDKGLPVTAFRQAQFAAVENYNESVSAEYRDRVIAVDSGPYYELELSDIYWKRRLTNEWRRRVERGEMSKDEFQEACDRFNFGNGELTEEEQATWDRCASNAEYHYLGSGKTFIRFGYELAEQLLELRSR